MRRGLLAVLVLLAGCGVGGGSGPGSARTVDHIILYDMRLHGGPGYKMQITYTDSSGATTKQETSSPNWSRQITVRYPDVTTVVLSGISTEQGAARLGSALPETECILWVDGEIVDQEKSLFPTCEAKLTATARPIPTVSPSRT